MIARPSISDAVKHIRANKALLAFLGRAILFYLVWVLVYYTNETLPILLNKWLTEFVAQHALWLLQFADQAYSLGSYTKVAQSMEFNLSDGAITLYLNGIAQINIADSCNGLELYVLFIGFLVSYKQSVRNKTFFIVGGMILLLAINALRIAGLALIHVYFTHYFDFIHHYLFTATMYAGIFAVWYWFTNLKYASS
jgi:exosortase/archaeosortase family protein